MEWAEMISRAVVRRQNTTIKLFPSWTIFYEEDIGMMDKKKTKKASHASLNNKCLPMPLRGSEL